MYNYVAPVSVQEVTRTVALPGESAFDELVLGIYRAAEAPEAWAECLQRICTALDGSGISLMHHDAQLQQRSVAAYEGFDERSMWLYRDYYQQLDPWGQALRRIDLTAGRVIDGREVVSSSDVVNSEFYVDFGRHVGTAQSMFGAIESDAKRTALIIVARAIDRPGFAATDRALLERLMPHLRQAFRLHRRITGADGVRATSCDALDRLTMGVVLVDRSGRPVFANAAARRLTAMRDGVSVERDRLCTTKAETTRRLSAAIAQATGVGVTGAESAFTIERPPGSGLRVVVVPVGRREDAIGFEVGAAAAVFIGDPDQRAIDDPAWLTDLFGLTAAEARVGARLANGETLADISDGLGLTIATTRWYVKQVLQKTGANTQAQFVSLVLRGLAGVKRRVDTDS